MQNNLENTFVERSRALKNHVIKRILRSLSC